MLFITMIIVFFSFVAQSDPGKHQEHIFAYIFSKAFDCAVKLEGLFVILRVHVDPFLVSLDYAVDFCHSDRF